MGWKKNSFEEKTYKELLGRFHDQERISIDVAIDEFLEPKTTYAYLLAQKKMRGIFSTIKRNLMKQGIVFGCINEDGEFGIPTAEEEHSFYILNSYKLMKGISKNTSRFVGSAKRHGYLKDSKKETLEITKPKEENDDNETDKPD